jgi:hydrogenase/urease accessory protein HupE
VSSRSARSTRSARAGLAVLAVLGALCTPALAHRLSPGYFGMAEFADGRYEVQWKVSISGGLVDVLEPQVPLGCTVDGTVRSYVVDDARIQHAVFECDGSLRGREVGVKGLDVTATDVLVRVDYLDGTSFTHRLVPESPSVIVPEQPGQLEVIGTYLVLGVEHILLGVDHLLFVLALLLIVRGLRRLVATITAFTVAHSITLAAATLGFVHVPSAPVEATIALSILFLATELARRRSGQADEGASLTLRFPWVVAFTFGLLHGFGFAGALSEVGLPDRAIPLALLFFNVGVEIGQLAFVAAVLLAGRAVRRTPAWAYQATAYVIGSVAAYWVFERTIAAI